MGLFIKSLLAVLTTYFLRNAESRYVPDVSIATADGEIDISRFQEAAIVLGKIDGITKGALGAAVDLQKTSDVIKKQRTIAAVDAAYNKAVEGMLSNLDGGKSKVHRLLKALANRVRSHIKSTVDLASIIGDPPRPELLHLIERAEKTEKEPIPVLEINPKNIVTEALKKGFRERDYPKNLYGKKTSSYKKLYLIQKALTQAQSKTQPDLQSIVKQLMQGIYASKNIQKELKSTNGYSENIAMEEDAAITAYSIANQILGKRKDDKGKKPEDKTPKIPEKKADQKPVESQTIGKEESKELTKPEGQEPLKEEVSKAPLKTDESQVKEGRTEGPPKSVEVKKEDEKKEVEKPQESEVKQVTQNEVLKPSELDAVKGNAADSEEARATENKELPKSADPREIKEQVNNESVAPVVRQEESNPENSENNQPEKPEDSRVKEEDSKPIKQTEAVVEKPKGEAAAAVEPVNDEPRAETGLKSGETPVPGAPMSSQDPKVEENTLKTENPDNGDKVPEISKDQNSEPRENTPNKKSDDTAPEKFNTPDQAHEGSDVKKDDKANQETAAHVPEETNTPATPTETSKTDSDVAANDTATPTLNETPKTDSDVATRETAGPAEKAESGNDENIDKENKDKAETALPAHEATNTPVTPDERPKSQPDSANEKAADPSSENVTPTAGDAETGKEPASTASGTVETPQNDHAESPMASDTPTHQASRELAPAVETVNPAAITEEPTKPAAPADEPLKQMPSDASNGIEVRATPVEGAVVPSSTAPPTEESGKPATSSPTQAPGTNEEKPSDNPENLAGKPSGDVEANPETVNQSSKVPERPVNPVAQEMPKAAEDPIQAPTTESPKSGGEQEPAPKPSVAENPASGADAGKGDSDAAVEKPKETPESQEPTPQSVGSPAGAAKELKRRKSKRIKVTIFRKGSKKYRAETPLDEEGNEMKQSRRVFEIAESSPAGSRPARLTTRSLEGRSTEPKAAPHGASMKRAYNFPGADDTFEEVSEEYDGYPEIDLTYRHVDVEPEPNTFQPETDNQHKDAPKLTSRGLYLNTFGPPGSSSISLPSLRSRDLSSQPEFTSATETTLVARDLTSPTEFTSAGETNLSKRDLNSQPEFTSAVEKTLVSRDLNSQPDFTSAVEKTLISRDLNSRPEFTSAGEARLSARDLNSQPEFTSAVEKTLISRDLESQPEFTSAGETTLKTRGLSTQSEYTSAVEKTLISRDLSCQPQFTSASEATLSARDLDSQPEFTSANEATLNSRDLNSEPQFTSAGESTIIAKDPDSQPDFTSASESSLNSRDLNFDLTGNSESQARMNSISLPSLVTRDHLATRGLGYLFGDMGRTAQDTIRYPTAAGPYNSGYNPATANGQDAFPQQPQFNWGQNQSRGVQGAQNNVQNPLSPVRNPVNSIQNPINTIPSPNFKNPVQNEQGKPDQEGSMLNGADNLHVAVYQNNDGLDKPGIVTAGINAASNVAKATVHTVGAVGDAGLEIVGGALSSAEGGVSALRNFFNY